MPCYNIDTPPGIASLGHSLERGCFYASCILSICILTAYNCDRIDLTRFDGGDILSTWQSDRHIATSPAPEDAGFYFCRGGVWLPHSSHPFLHSVSWLHARKKRQRILQLEAATLSSSLPAVLTSPAPLRREASSQKQFDRPALTGAADTGQCLPQLYREKEAMSMECMICELRKRLGKGERQ